MARLLKTALGLGLCLGLTLSGGVSLAVGKDAVYFHNGKVMNGKVKRVTGEIIEFSAGLDSPQTIRRLTLSNRNDIVETRDGQKYFGEIVYIDAFRIEMATSTGKVRLNRLLTRSIVLGSPLQQPMTDYADTLQRRIDTQAQPVMPPEPGFHNVNSKQSTGTPSGAKPLVSFPNDLPESRPVAASHQRIEPAAEDMDAIPSPEYR